MVYDKENDRIISAAGSDLEIYPTGPTFSDSEGIEVESGGESVFVNTKYVRELIDGLVQAANRLGI